MTYSLLNLFGCVGTIITSFIRIDTDPEAKLDLEKFEEHKFIEISEQLMALPISLTPSNENIFNEFASEVITSDDDAEIFVALIILDAFQHLNIDASTENLDYYKEFLVGWFISAVTDDDWDEEEESTPLKTISDVYNRMTVNMTRFMNEIKCADNDDLFVSYPEKREEINKLFELYSDIIIEQKLRAINDFSTKLSQFAIDMKKQEALKLVKKAIMHN